MPRPTLLVVDVQKAWDDPALGQRNNDPSAEENVARLLQAWRTAEAPIIQRSATRDGSGRGAGLERTPRRPRSLSSQGENGNHFRCLRDCSFSKQISSINSVSTTMRWFNVTVHGLV